MSELKKLLGKRIKQLRKIKGITQEELADSIGIGVANISYIETGKFAPSIENFEKIAKTLEVQPYELYLFAPSKTPNEMRNELLNVINKDTAILYMLYKYYKNLEIQ